MVGEVAADFFDRPIALVWVVKLDLLWQIPYLTLEFAREDVQAFDEALMPSAAGFASRIREYAH